MLQRRFCLALTVPSGTPPHSTGLTKTALRRLPKLSFKLVVAVRQIFYFNHCGFDSP